MTDQIDVRQRRGVSPGHLLLVCAGADVQGGRETKLAMITLKRAYDAVSCTDGARLLVERLWPRGISKARLRVDAWLNSHGGQAQPGHVL